MFDPTIIQENIWDWRLEREPRRYREKLKRNGPTS